MKKNNIKNFYTYSTIVSILLTRIFDFMFLGDLKERDFLSAFVIYAIVLIGLIFIFKYIIDKRFPKEALRYKRERQDERAVKVRGKASFYTMIFMGVSYFILAAVPEQCITSDPYSFPYNYSVIILYLIITTMVFYLIIHLILDNRK